jgi:hypothetical protein
MVQFYHVHADISVKLLLAASKANGLGEESVAPTRHEARRFHLGRILKFCVTFLTVDVYFNKRGSVPDPLIFLRRWLV